MLMSEWGGSRLRQTLMDSQSKIVLLQHMAERKDEPKNHQKKTLFWDREHLYAENLMLRNQIKELTTANTQAKTRLLTAQKEVTMALKDGKSKSVSLFRSASTVGRAGSAERISIVWKRGKAEENLSRTEATLRGLVEELRAKVQQLQNENGSLKKSIKYTRMSELQVENREMQEENQRMHRLAVQAKQMQEQAYELFCKEVEEAKSSMRKENEVKAHLVRELSRAKRDTEELLARLREAEKAKLQAERRLYVMSNIKKQSGTSRPESRQREQLISELNTRLDYSPSALDRSEAPSINFDRLAFDSNPKLHSRKPSSIEDTDSKHLSEGPFTSLELLPPEDFRSPGKKQPVKESIEEEKYEDEF